MSQAIKTDWIFKSYVFVMSLYIFRIYNVSWLDSFSSVFFMLLTLSFSFLFFLYHSKIKIEKQSVSSILLLLLYCLYTGLITHIGDSFSIIKNLTLFVSMSSIILFTEKQKLFILDFITNAYILILVVSLFGWFLYLSGINLPHSELIFHQNGFHRYYDYYLFRVDITSMEGIFPRFQSIFLEPGQLATPCVFLFYLNSLETSSQFKRIVLLVAIVLSFSLIAYGLLLVSIVSIAWFKGARYRIPLTIFSLLAIAGFFLFFLTVKDSAVNALILSRLVYDEENIIVGNNRTSLEFDNNYVNFIQSGDKYLGIHNQIKNGSDWTIRASGYKKFIVHHGIVGFVIFLLYIFSLYWGRRNIKSFVFLFMLITAFFVRNLLQSPMWMSIAIVGFYLLNDGVSLKSEGRHDSHSSIPITKINESHR